MTSSSRTRPDLEGANAPHWLGARDGRVVVQACRQCGRHRYPAAPLCMACASPAFTWQAIRTTGVVHAWCRFHRPYFSEFADRMPYTVLWVRMDDGVDLFANFDAAHCHDTPAIGQPVEAVFEDLDAGVTLVRFRATATEQAA